MPLALNRAQKENGLLITCKGMTSFLHCVFVYRDGFRVHFFLFNVSYCLSEVLQTDFHVCLEEGMGCSTKSCRLYEILDLFVADRFCVLCVHL